MEEQALQLFASTGVAIRSCGSSYLGGALGDEEFRVSFMAAMVEKWCHQLRTLAEMAQTQPQAAYTVFAKGLSSRWKYHIRCSECPPEVFSKLDLVINSDLLPALTGRELTLDQPERVLLSLPA